MSIQTTALPSVRTAQSTASDAREAVRQLLTAIKQPDMALILFFCSSDYDLDALADELNSQCAGARVIGCTTAGEIGPFGFSDHGLTGVSFSAADFTVASGYIENLRQFQFGQGHVLAQDLLQQLKHARPRDEPLNAFAVQLIDGLSVREEPVTQAFRGSLGSMSMVGGSAGDGLNFRATSVFADGVFRRDSVALVLVHTMLPFKAFKTQHFVPTDRRLVVTQADVPNRIVQEIDGWPAAEAYTKLVGLDTALRDSMGFANAPMVVMIDGTNYIRSIQRANPDGSLTFFSAIDEGLTMRLARGGDLVANLEQSFTEIRSEIGEPQLVLCFDCILRKLEIQRNGLEPAVADIFKRGRAVGFSSYGEQFGGVHVNQTLTGIAIGGRRGRSI